MATFVLTGLIAGSVYALLAVGLVFMYQTTGVVNFAFGAFGAIGAFTFATLRVERGAFLALVLVVIGGVVLGALIGRATTGAQTTSTTVKAVASLALTQAIIGIVPLVWGTAPRQAPTLATSIAFELFDVVVSWQQVITFVVAFVAALVIVAFFRFGMLGSALRAMAANTNVARLIGLPVRRLWVLSWALSTAIAALAGVLIAPSLGLAASSISFAVLYPLAAALVASFRRPLVAMGAAFALGVGDSVVRSQVEPFTFEILGSPLSTYAQMIPFLVVVGALVLGRSGRFSAWERV
jgi:branched-subunit amino acid ABC-type transport system permease component